MHLKIGNKFSGENDHDCVQDQKKKSQGKNGNGNC